MESPFVDRKAMESLLNLPPTFTSALLDSDDLLYGIVGRLDFASCLAAAGACSQLRRAVTDILREHWVPTEIVHVAPGPSYLTFVAANSHNTFYVSDNHAKRVLHVGWQTSSGTGSVRASQTTLAHAADRVKPKIMAQPSGIFVAHRGESSSVFVCDVELCSCTEYEGIAVHTDNGRELMCAFFGLPGSPPWTPPAASVLVPRTEWQPAAGAPKLVYPMGCAYSAAHGGRLFITDGDLHCVQVFEIAISPSPAVPAHGASAPPPPPPRPAHLFTCGTGPGTADGQMRDPFGVAVANGRVYVSDSGNGRIAIFDEADGRFLGTLRDASRHRSSSSRPAAADAHVPLKLVDPAGVALTSNGRGRDQLVVAETRGRVRVFTLDFTGLSVTCEAHHYEIMGDLAGVCVSPPPPAVALPVTLATPPAHHTSASSSADLQRNEAGAQDGAECVLVVNATKGSVHVLQPATLATVRKFIKAQSDARRRGAADPSSTRIGEGEHVYIDAMLSLRE